MEHICKNCSAQFNSKITNRQFCSSECWYASQRKPRTRFLQTYECPICKLEFNSYAQDRKYCSRRCFQLAPKSDIMRSKLSIAKIGGHLSLETRGKLSKSLIGNKRTLGRKHTQKELENLSILNAGEKNKNWRGGISRLPYCFGFNANLKKHVKTRDDFRCVNCGNVGDKFGRLSIHHIDYNKNNCDEHNLITTCSSCNSKANFNREFWTGFYQNKIVEIYLSIESS